MVSERQLLLGAIATLLCLLVYREISTLTSAENARPAQQDPAQAHVWKQLNSDLQYAHVQKDQSYPSFSASISTLATAAPESQLNDLGSVLLREQASHLNALPGSLSGSPDVVFSASAVAQQQEAVQSTPAQPSAALTWNRGSIGEASSPPTKHRPSNEGPFSPQDVVAALASQPPAQPLTPVALRLKGKRNAALKPTASSGKLKWASSWAGIGLEKRRHQGNQDNDDSSSSASPRVPSFEGLSSGLRANRTAFGPSKAGQKQLPFSGAFMCHDVSESYGAAWIIHKRKFLKTGFGPPWTEHFDTKDMAKPDWSVGRNVTFRSVNMEGASHIVLKRTKGALKTVDAFDFLVEHLSIYERRLGLLHLPSKHQKLVAQQVIHVMRRREQALKVGWSLGGSASGEALDLYQHHGQGSSGSSGVSASSVASRAALQARVGVGGDVTKSSVSATLEADAAEEVTEKELAAAWQRVADGTAWGGSQPGDKVVATMPFYGSGVGTGHSMAQTRFIYLNATFFSISKVFKHVVVFVVTEADRDYCLHRSGLPFYQVVLIDNLANPKLLGVASVLEMQRKFQSQEWSHFDWMYFTESDQVLHLRPHQLRDLLATASDDVNIVAPHRFLPFPHPDDFAKGFFESMKSITGGLRKELENIEAKSLVSVADESVSRCCFDRGNCRRRDQWVYFKDKQNKVLPIKGAASSSVHLLRTSGSPALINGEGNLFKMSFRTCAITQARECPVSVRR